MHDYIYDWKQPKFVSFFAFSGTATSFGKKIFSPGIEPKRETILFGPEVGIVKHI